MSVRHFALSIPTILVGLALCVWAVWSLGFKYMLGFGVLSIAGIALCVLALCAFMKNPAEDLPEGVVRITDVQGSLSERTNVQRKYIEKDGVVLSSEVIPTPTEINAYLLNVKAGN